MGSDIIDRLLDFERCGLTAADRVNMRECAAIEIHKLRLRIEALKKSAPAQSAAQNTAEGLPSSDAAVAGADTCQCGKDKTNCTYPYHCRTFRVEKFVTVAPSRPEPSYDNGHCVLCDGPLPCYTHSQGLPETYRIT